MSDVTLILQRIEGGDPAAAEKLLPAVYDELRKLAAGKMAQEVAGHTLQATALVHEVWLRLVAPEQQAVWHSRSHFFAAAAEAMRHILVDRARQRNCLKRGGGQERVKLDLDVIPAPASDDELLAVDEALERLASQDPQKAELVKLRFFAGLTIEQAAETLGISTSTADRYWAYARAWLFREIARSRDTAAS